MNTHVNVSLTDTLRFLRLTTFADAPDAAAANEVLAHVTVHNAHELLRVAYHLGNRHVAVEIGHGFLRALQDSVLENMVRGLGVTIERVMATFEPKSGVHTGTHAGTHDHGRDHHDHSHSHGHEDGKARIHDFSDAVKTNKEG